MELIIDFEFSKDFYIKNNTKSENILDFTKHVGRLILTKLITNYLNSENLYTQIHQDPLLELLINERAPTLEFISNLDSKIFEEEFYEYGSAIKLFLLNKEESICTELSRKFGYECISPENFERKWTNYRSDRVESYRLVTKSKLLPKERKFISWESLGDFPHPLNAIVINDRYILNDTIDQRIEKNLLPLLKVLLKNAAKNIKVQIIIFIYDANRSFNYEAKHRKILHYLTNELQLTNIELNICSGALHSRFIITNFYTITSENSFNYFRDNGDVFNDQSTISVTCHFSSQQYILMKEKLLELKMMVRKLQNSTTAAEYTVKNYFPEKKNRIIDFL